MSLPFLPARRWLRRLVIGVAAVVILAIAIPFSYIHFVDGSSPAKLTLTPSSGTGSSATGSSSATDTAAVTGTWSVGAGSIVGYRVNETLVGQKAIAVGRTSDVTGTMVVDATTVTRATFVAQMADVTSNQSQRDKQFDGRIMDVSQYPTATFALTGPIDLGSVPATGTVHSYPATGELTLRGQTHPVKLTISAERTATQIEVQGEIPVAFATWGVPNPSFGSFVTTADNGTLEFLLKFQMGTAGAATQSSPTTATTIPQGSGGGAGGYGGSGGYPPPGGAAPGGQGGPGISIAPGTTAPLSIGG